MAHALPTNWVGNGTGLLEGMALWANNVTNGLFWALMLMAFGVVVMIATSRFGGPRSFGYASFVGMIGSVFLTIAGLMSWGIASMFIVVGFVGFVVMILNER